MQKADTGTPFLDQYSRDLTVMAAEGKLDPVVGRDERDHQADPDFKPQEQKQSLPGGRNRELGKLPL